MFKYLSTALALILATLYALFRSKANKVKVLEEVTKSQEETIRISEAKEEVSNVIQFKLEEEEAKISSSTKEKKNEIKDSNDTIMDNDFIRLLDEDDLQD